jgi:hypothetical protein
MALVIASVGAGVSVVVVPAGAQAETANAKNPNANARIAPSATLLLGGGLRGVLAVATFS